MFSFRPHIKQIEVEHPLLDNNGAELLDYEGQSIIYTTTEKYKFWLWFKWKM